VYYIGRTMRSSSVIQVTWRAAVVCAVGAVGNLIGHMALQGSWFPQPEALTGACEAPETIATIAELPAEAAGDLCASSDVVVLDVRSPELFAAGHVEGAVHLPCSRGTLENHLADRLAAARLIIVYGQSSDDARPVAESLLRRGVIDVRLIAGGYPAWERAGQACSSGPCPGCLEGHL